MEGNELRAMLQEGWVNIRFQKISTGEVRNTTATTRLDLMPLESHPKGKNIKRAEGHVCFFDLTTNAWRSLRVENILSCEMNDFLNSLIK